MLRMEFKADKHLKVLNTNISSQALKNVEIMRSMLSEYIHFFIFRQTILNMLNSSIVQGEVA